MIYYVTVYYVCNNERYLFCLQSGGDVDVPQCREGVVDDLLLDPPEGGVPHLLFIFPAVSHRGRAASPVVV